MICTASPLRLRASVVLAAVAISALAPVSAARATTTQHFSYTGSAYGTSVKVGSVVKSGPSAPVTFGCTTNGDLHKTNTVAGINVPTLATSGTVSTRPTPTPRRSSPRPRPPQSRSTCSAAWSAPPPSRL